MNHWSRPLLLVFTVLLVPSYAHADEPTKAECIAANDVAQDLRREGKLREAREKLALCVSTSCPGAVREDCAQRLTEIDHAMPSIVFDVKDAAGNDVVAVVVTMDGQRLTDKLNGLPVQVDPGEHRFVFETQGLPSTEKTIVIHEGERDRHERVSLGQPVVPVPTPPPSSPAGSPQQTIAYVAGGAGVVGLVIGSVLGLVSKGTYDHALQSECGNNWNGGCTSQGIADGKSAHSQAAASTVAFVAGAALLGAGAVLYFTVPKTTVTVGTTVGAERAGMVVTGAW